MMEDIEAAHANLSDGYLVKPIYREKLEDAMHKLGLIPR